MNGELSKRGRGKVPIVIALSARWHAFPERFHWIAENGFALEYTPDPQNIGQLSAHVDAALRKGIPVRYHGFFPGWELGHPDPAVAGEALQLHKEALEAIGNTMRDRGEAVITVHVGLDPAVEIDPEHVIANLAQLVRCGKEHSVTVCLENLRRGPTSRPETLLAWAAKSGARITFDAGHAVSSQSVKSGAYSPVEFLDMVAPRVHEAHVYGREEDRHYPIESAEGFLPLADRLRKTGCRWWTVELEDYGEALQTRKILLACLGLPA